LVAILGGGCAEPPPSSPPSQACVGEKTRPLTATELRRTLRRHGFTVYRTPGDAICDAPVAERMPVSVSNVLFEGPHENIDRHEEISEREGHVFCGLRRGPIWGWRLDEDLDAPPSSPIFSGDKATFSFANLECTLYPEGERAEIQVRNLQRAVRELVRIARQKRS
jgi:hypothetical protein